MPLLKGRSQGGGHLYPVLERPTPLVDLLKERPLLIERKRLLGTLGITDPPQLPPGVSREEAVGVVKETWGKKLAAGMADRAGLTGAEREKFIERWSTVVSEGLLRGV